MIRKFAIAFAALAAIGVASLASTAPAEAGWKGGKHHHFHGHKHWGHGYRHFRPVYYGGCWRKVWVGGPYYGYFRRINVCY
ncbi:hypothetical protein [Pseudorhodoplanes sinuspersici]|uniref:Uncharacterized protein n=1 Tax=Pseudorhodoplanes sinuspersici TaxID=1235591 RepID=A0A1W6ZY98_9HYPH|nr:hypothetical protein [Pseudorhodoplanes sinuspersici]ARQ02121.1 hypothetical protein CAK95_25745 [Pseudorhodoplanes sinuspersici]RKE73926.1 hypothetical protein DFP91_1824 [Pseudorhodoplanes sinuspersici]